MATNKNNIGGMIILDGNDTNGVHKVSVESIAERVVSTTQFDPENKYSLIMSEELATEQYSKEELERRHEILQAAADLKNHINATTKSNNAEKNDETLADRYQKLLECINEYNNADPLVQAAVGAHLNRAINSMNREHTATDINREMSEAEKQFISSINDISIHDLSASHDLIEAFNTYKELSKEEQQSVLPTLQSAYRSYMSDNIDDEKIKQGVQDAYGSLRKTFTPNITFDVAPLEASKDNALIQELSSIDGSKISYRELESIVGYHVRTKEELESIHYVNQMTVEMALKPWQEDKTNFQSVENDLKKYLGIDMTPELREQLEKWKTTPGEPIPEIVRMDDIPKIETLHSNNHDLQFSSLNLNDQSITYNEYLRILDEYSEAHPRSINARNLSEHLQNTYISSVQAERDLPMLENIRALRQLDASATSQQRDFAVYDINDILDSYSRLNQEDKQLYRGLVQETVDHFNDYKLHNVVVPHETLQIELLREQNLPEQPAYTAPDFNRYINTYISADYDFQRDHFADMLKQYDFYSSERTILSFDDQLQKNLEQIRNSLQEKYGDGLNFDKSVEELQKLTVNFSSLSYSDKQDVFIDLQGFCEKHEINSVKVINNASVKFEAALDSYLEKTNLSPEEANSLKNYIMTGSASDLVQKYVDEYQTATADVKLASQILTNPEPPRAMDDYGTKDYLQEVLGIVENNNVELNDFFDSSLAKNLGVNNIEELRTKIEDMSYIERLQCVQALTDCCAADPSVVSTIQDIQYTTGMYKEAVNDVATTLKDQEPNAEEVVPIALTAEQQQRLKQFIESKVVEFDDETKTLQEAMELRSKIVHTREFDSESEDKTYTFLNVLNQAKAIESADVRSYIAITAGDKCEGYYLSGEQKTELLYVGFHNDKQITLKIEEVVGPNCFIGRVSDEEDKMLIITPQPLNLGITKDDRDVYSKLTGIPSFDLSPEIESRLNFGVENGKLIASLAIPARELSENQTIQSQHLSHDMEVVKISPSGTGSMLLLKNQETQEITEVRTTLSESTIMRSIIADVYTDAYRLEATLNQSEFALTKNIDIELQQNANVATNRLISIYNVNDDAWNSFDKPEPLPIQQNEFFRENGNLQVRIDNQVYQVYACHEIVTNDGPQFHALVKNNDGTLLHIADERSASHVAESLVSINCSQRELGENDKFNGIVNYYGVTSVCLKEGNENHYYPICDIDSTKSFDGKARIFYMDESNGQKHFIVTDEDFDRVQSQFASKQVKLIMDNDKQMPIESQERAQSSMIQFNQDQIYYAYTDMSGKAKEGMLVHVDKNGCLLSTEDRGLVFVHDETAYDKLLTTKDISIVKSSDDKFDICYGTGADVKTLLTEQPTIGTSKLADIISPENASTFIRESFQVDSKGNNIFTTKHTSNTTIENEEIVYLHAQRSDTNPKNIDVFIVAQSENGITGYQLNNIGLSDFRIMTQYAKLYEVCDNDEKRALERLNAGRLDASPEKTELNELLNAFNRIKGNTTEIDSIKHVPDPGDISLAKLTFTDGHYILRGKDYENHAITIRDPIMQRENGEMYIYSMTNEGVQKNRIVSTAYGAYADLEKINAKTMEWERLVNKSNIYENVRVEHTTISNFDSKTTDLTQLFERKVGMSCSSEFGYSIAPNSLTIAQNGSTNTDIKIAMDYGVIIKDTPDGAKFIYYNPDSESGLKKNMTMYTGQKLQADDIPINASDAKDKKFVLVDYENGVAIREGGMCYSISKEQYKIFTERLMSEKLEIPKNFYDEKIAQPETALLKYSTFVSPEKFEGASVDIKPMVDNWSIYNSKGNFMLSFNDVCFDDSTTTIGKQFEIQRLYMGSDGLYAKIASPMDHELNSTSKVYDVRLGMPTEEQIKAIENATANLPLNTAYEKLDAYCNMIELANNNSKYNNSNIELHRGDYISVQDENSKLGVLYKVINNQGDLMIVGNTDNEIVHSSFLSKDDLERKNISRIELPEDAISRMKFAERIVYTETEISPTGKANVTLGDRDLASGHVEGITYKGCDHKDSEVIADKESSKDEEREL